jgi:hypothetical protein
LSICYRVTDSRRYREGDENEGSGVTHDDKFRGDKILGVQVYCGIGWIIGARECR